ncbi:uncharacterized protein LOC124304471 isoform X2 [Neodiprion virginianus]|uniref:uncharacterized protein LOC124304471 isoform X2 n=1 Tax=Neodiprion virginianus TaxID=2961670 RepID=UPI001EE6B237|nr:uncharacterized protein LOC124304471 isoform X2 [Neodiprion virginianus]
MIFVQNLEQRSTWKCGVKDMRRWEEDTETRTPGSGVYCRCGRRHMFGIESCREGMGQRRLTQGQSTLKKIKIKKRIQSKTKVSQMKKTILKSITLILRIPI